MRVFKNNRPSPSNQEMAYALDAYFHAHEKHEEVVSTRISEMYAESTDFLEEPTHNDLEVETSEFSVWSRANRATKILREGGLLQNSGFLNLRKPKPTHDDFVALRSDIGIVAET